MDELKPILSHGKLNNVDVAAVLKGLESGIYRASDLYDRYCAAVRIRDRRDLPASKKNFGAALRAVGCDPWRVKGYAAWLVWPEEDRKPL